MRSRPCDGASESTPWRSRDRPFSPTHNSRRGGLKEAAAIAERVRAANADLIPPRLLLANLYVSQGRLAEAQTLVGEVRGINPELTAEHAATRMAAVGGREEIIARLRSAGLP